MRALDALEDLGARITEARTHMPRPQAVGDEVTGEHDNVGLKRIDVADHLPYEKWLCVFVVVDIADLRNAQTMERPGQPAQPDGLLDDFEIMPIPEAGIGDQSAAGGESGDLEKAAPGDPGL